MNLQEKSARQKSVYDVFGESTRPANHNISSVLSQIQDDGPAHSDSPVYPDSVEQRNRHDFRSNDSENKYSGWNNNDRSSVVDKDLNSVPHDDLIQDEVHLDFSETLKKKQSNASEQAKSPGPEKPRRTTIFSGKKMPSLPFMIAAIVILVVVSYLYRLDVRTDKLEQSLILHEENVLESIDFQTAKLSPEINTLKKTLNSVRDEIELIKAASVSDNQEQSQAVHVYENMNTLKDEVVMLRSELQTVIKNLNSISKKNQIAGHKAVNIKKDKTSVTEDSWVVNIASFTEKARSLNASKILSSSGYPSSIEEAVVNGVQVYRIVVDGFNDRAKAEVFVRKAASEYGMKNGWIRKNNVSQAQNL